MKIELESQLNAYYSDKMTLECSTLFWSLVDNLQRITSPDEVRSLFYEYNSKYFAVGCGGSHGWVKQRLASGGVCKERLLYIPFNYVS